MAGWSQVKVRGHRLRLRPIGCTPTLLVTYSADAAAVAACGAIYLSAFTNSDMVKA